MNLSFFMMFLQFASVKISNKVSKASNNIMLCRNFSKHVFKQNKKTTTEVEENSVCICLKQMLRKCIEIDIN